MQSPLAQGFLERAGIIVVSGVASPNQGEL
jgi:hypothetical protein